MWLKSHHWVNNPTSTSERRVSLNAVRVRTETVRLFDIKYRDIDTGKLNSDCLHTPNSTSYQDEVTEEWEDYSRHRRSQFERNTPRKTESWFTPKDDDFDKPEPAKQVMYSHYDQPRIIRCIDRLLSCYTQGKR